LETTNGIQSGIWAAPSDGRKIRLPYSQVGKTIKVDASSLHPGAYYLQMVSKGVHQSIHFCKILNREALTAGTGAVGIGIDKNENPFRSIHQKNPV